MAWTREEVYFDGHDYFNAVIQDIQSAQRVIQFETYIIEPGRLADRVLHELQQAASRGVRVQLTIDEVGSQLFERHYSQQLDQSGIEILYVRALWRTFSHQLTVIANTLRFLAGDWRMNKGLHRKAVVIDERVAYVGSFNVIDDVDSTLTSQYWLEIGVRLEGQGVQAISGMMRLLWGEAVPARLLRDENVFSNHERKIGRVAKHRLGALLRTARRRVIIQTPYFVPPRPQFRILRQLLRKGVQVQIVVPEKTDLYAVAALGFRFLEELHRLGAEVYLYRPRFLHQKVFVVDDQVIVGSSNFNHRSFLHDLELDVQLNHQHSKEQLIAQYLTIQEQSVRFHPSMRSSQPWWARAFLRLILLLKYWC